MSLDTLKFRPTFQAKILIPVIALLILLPAITLTFVHRSSMETLQNQSEHALQTADAVFQNSLDLRKRQLIARCKNVVGDPRFFAVAKLAHAPTMREHLNERLASEALGEDAVFAIFYNEKGEPAASASRESRELEPDFARTASRVLQPALLGQAGSIIIPVQARVFQAIAVPVFVDERLTGALLVGVGIGPAVLRELTFIVRGEGAFLANGEIAASTFRIPVSADVLPRWTAGKGSGAARTESVEINKTHYLALASRFPSSPPDANVGYALLISYEAALQQLRHAEATLWLLCLLGIVLSTAVISFLIRKITAPLRELRTNAEAVGEGDFTRRVPVRSTDEFGQLTHAFNQMTRNLRSSHSELQKTVETLKATQAQLIQSEKLSAVGEFVSGIAHELNNPLTAIIGFGEMLKEADLGAKYQGYLQYIVRSSERCHKIVHGLLSFARQHPPERKLVQLNGMVDDVVELLAYEMRTSNIQVERKFLPDLPPIMGDSHQLQQVVLNLLNNGRQAIQAHQPSGKICISTSVTGDRVLIQIEDNGPGISAENLSKIFNPFFTTKPIGKGTGLGLSLCYGIIREHGGAITAQSPPGHGAIFQIELPIHRAAASAESKPADLARAPVTGTGKKALVVDDEEWILELVRQLLKQDGFDVDTAIDGTAALDRVSQSRYELLVCDWKMPGLSGTQLFDRIQAISPEAANRVIFMTGDVVSDSFQQFLQKNSKNCLSKPFSVHEFRRTIGDFIAAHN